jgi:hypothetical protein
MEFIAKVEDSQMANIQEIAKSLEKMGIQIRHILRATGIIAGSSSSLPLNKLKIKGIQSIQRNRQVRAL